MEILANFNPRSIRSSNRHQTRHRITDDCLLGSNDTAEIKFVQVKGTSGCFHVWRAETEGTESSVGGDVEIAVGFDSEGVDSFARLVESTGE